MTNVIDKALFNFVSSGLIEEINELGISSFKKNDLIESGFDEFDHGIGGFSYGKDLLLYAGRQEVRLVIFFNRDEESFHHLQFECNLRLRRFLKKYFLSLRTNHNLIFYKATNIEFSESYGIKTNNSVIHFRKDSAKGSPYIRVIESINEHLTDCNHSNTGLTLFESQFSPIDSLSSTCNDKELKEFLDSITK